MDKQVTEACRGCSWVDFKINSVPTTWEHIEQMPEVVALGSHCFKMYCEYCFEHAEKMRMRNEGIPPDIFYIAAEQVKKWESVKS